MNAASKATPCGASCLLGAGSPCSTCIGPLCLLGTGPPRRYGTSTQKMSTIPTSVIPPSPTTDIQSGTLRRFPLSTPLGCGDDGGCADEVSVVDSGIAS